VNYIGHYILPWDWINHPEETHCNGKRETVQERTIQELSFCAVCNQGGDIEVSVHLESGSSPGVGKVTIKRQYKKVILQKLFIDFLAQVIYYHQICPASVRLLKFSFKRLLLKNHFANFNQTWWETYLGDGDSDLSK